MNKQALIKLATLRLAINHVLRQRMTKQAFWPFSKPKLDFSKPGWEENPKILKEVLKDLSSMDHYADYKAKPQPGTIAGDAYLNLIKNRPDIAEAELFPTKTRGRGMKGYGLPFREYLENKLNLVKPDTISFLENLQGFTDAEWDRADANASKETLSPKELALMEAYMKASKLYGASEQKNILNSGLDGLSRLYWNIDSGKDYEPEGVEPDDWDKVWDMENAIEDAYWKKVKKLTGHRF